MATALSGNEGLRFVTIAGAGINAPGDAKGALDTFIAWSMRRLVPFMLADRQAELGILQQSRLRWTMLRPPVLNDRTAEGAYRLSFDQPPSKGISRADVAHAVVDALGRGKLNGRAPFVAW